MKSPPLIDAFNERGARLHKTTFYRQGLPPISEVISFLSVEAAEQWLSPGGFLLTVEGKTAWLWDPSLRIYVTLLDHLNVAPVGARRWAAMNVASSKHLRVLSKDSDTAVRRSVAINARTMPSTLSQMAKDKESVVRLAVARNKGSNSDTLDLLSKDTDTGVRAEVAGNSMTPASALSKLALAPEYSVLSRLVENSNLQADVLDILSTNPFGHIKESVVRHKNTSDDTLLKMAKDPDPNMSDFARHMLTTRALSRVLS